MTSNLPLVYDVTLRDGSHANGHSFTAKFCCSYIDNAYSAGIRFIEIGHGNGLGGSSLHIGKMKETHLWETFKKKADQYRDLSIGVHVIPGLATFADINEAMNNGASVFRIASHCTEADTTETYIDYVANHGGEIWGLLMMSHMIRPDHLARRGQENGELWCVSHCFSRLSGALTPSCAKLLVS